MMLQGGGGYQPSKPVMIRRGYRQDEDPFAGIGEVASALPPHPRTARKTQTEPFQPPSNSNSTIMMHSGFRSPASAPTMPPPGQESSSCYQSPLPLVSQTQQLASPPMLSQSGMGLGQIPPPLDIPSAPPSTPTSWHNQSDGIPTPSTMQRQQSCESSLSLDQQQLASPPIHGMFLGLVKPPNNSLDQDDEDPELRRAREAALYAEEVILEESEKRQMDKARGPLGFGILPRAQGFFSSATGGGVTDKKKSHDPNHDDATKPQRAASPRCDIHVDDVDGEYDRHPSWLTLENDDRRPPWFSSENKRKSARDDSNTTDSDRQRQEPKQGAAVVGASVVGAVAGLVALGPLAAVVAAGGAAYAAGTKQKTVVGKALNETGGLVAKAGSAAKRFDNEHEIFSKTASGVAKGVGWVARQTLAASSTDANK